MSLVERLRSLRERLCKAKPIRGKYCKVRKQRTEFKHPGTGSNVIRRQTVREFTKYNKYAIQREVQPGGTKGLD